MLCLGPQHPASQQEVYENRDSASSSEMTLILLLWPTFDYLWADFLFASYLHKGLLHSSISPKEQLPRIKRSHLNSLSVLSCRSLCFYRPS